MPEPFRYCPRCAKPLAPRAEEGRQRLACPDAACGYVFYDNPTPVVAGVIEHQGAVLLVRNRGWPEKLFGLVSGFLEKGEAPEAGMLRELREETGLSGTIVSLIGAYPFEMMNQVILAYHVRAEGELALGAELAGAKHVPVEKLRAWEFGTGLAVRDWLAARRGPS